MSHMEQVAKMLGVELGEKFRVEGFDDKFMLTLTGMFYYDIEDSKWQESLLIYDILKGTRKIIKIPKIILEEAEKEYLSNVIKPFRKRVIMITKRQYSPNTDYISISYLDIEDSCQFRLELPIFKKGTMYKGMELNKEYTLEDLGL